MRTPICANCDLVIVSESVWRCADSRCNVPLCSPNLRDCGFAHWRSRHTPKPVVEVKASERL